MEKELTPEQQFWEDNKEELKVELRDRIPATIDSDINFMHKFYGHDKIVDAFDGPKLKKLLKFRLDFLKEELDETLKAFDDEDPEEIVDGIIDLIVVGVGTLDLFKVDTSKAWYSVFLANIDKEVGIKEGRPNPLGLPDLVKPAGWKAPSHEGNHGRLTEAFE